MSMIYQTTGLVQTADSQRRNVSVFRNCWNAFQEWRKWERLRRDLYSLNDQELKDIGITYGEIDYVASNQNTDPRGIRSVG
ncbi:uncharacterized protein YjiS (DUF1127 family) [Bradyrhizobium sp. LA6.1]|uniref:DUF1127 domain-containing protein n=1 Tax=Bradyrhizobium sp. LA6.1 TaxID=3156378 RepID=UPI003393B47D